MRSPTCYTTTLETSISSLMRLVSRKELKVMRQNWQRVLLMAVLMITLAAPALLAQKYEFNPYGGFYWPNHTNVGRIRNSSIWGGRFGYFFDPNFELEGNVGYLNHFSVTGIGVKNRGILYEVAGAYNFSAQEWPFHQKFTPFLLLGGGAIQSLLRDTDSFDFIGPSGKFVRMTNNNTFFQVSYGGGLKSEKLWGPLGARFDIRGRTLPNYYHSTPTWLELTGGVNFMFGER